MRLLRGPRRLLIALVHVGLWTIGLAFSLLLRFDFAVPKAALLACLVTLPVLAAARLIIFMRAGLCDGLFRYTGFLEVRRIALASAVPSVLLFVAAPLVPGMPRTVIIAEWLASILAVGGVRMVIRALHESTRSQAAPKATPTLLVGLNDTGEAFLRELQRLHGAQTWKVVGFLDDHPDTVGARVHGVPVLGRAAEGALRACVESHGVEQVVFALSEVASRSTRELVAASRRLGLRTLVLPCVPERMSEAQSPAAREIVLEDLLGREPVRLDFTQVDRFLRGRAVVVTGAGGSIGSELARQVLRFGPRELVLFDHDENALFFIERELRALRGDTEVQAMAGDITDRDRVAFVFDRCEPDVVLHAAAHKHVAMMESNACEAARNNALGTQVLAEAADAAGTPSFVLISTDKAVNPSSVMGASKRVCEMIIQHVARSSTTRFAAVRFGNVLGSNGSVVPLFREQIARGGPVTVTHPEVTRYFMTIPEAAGLVLQAGALGETGKVFLLDMGAPVKIVDLARAVIELSGLRVGIDIELRFTGLKAGEKLTEELLLGHEASEERPHPKIMVGRVRAPAPQDFEDGMLDLRAAIRANDDRSLRDALARLVPEATLTPGRAPAHRSRRAGGNKPMHLAAQRARMQGDDVPPWSAK